MRRLLELELEYGKENGFIIPMPSIARLLYPQQSHALISDLAASLEM